MGTNISCFRGIHHLLPCWDWLLRLWCYFLCYRQHHLWSEVLSSVGNEHYLVCDACQLMVVIAHIDEQYVRKDSDDC